jgi:hypothetical protein
MWETKFRTRRFTVFYALITTDTSARGYDVANLTVACHKQNLLRY